MTKQELWEHCFMRCLFAELANPGYDDEIDGFIESASDYADAMVEKIMERRDKHNHEAFVVTGSKEKP